MQIVPDLKVYKKVQCELWLKKVTNTVKIVARFEGVLCLGFIVKRRNNVLKKVNNVKKCKSNVRQICPRFKILVML